jgi:4-hydroxybenzoate polyprenyltransferase
MMVVVLISLPLFWGRQMVYPLVGIASSWLYSTIVRKHDALLANLLTASTIILVLISADAGQQLNSVAVVFDAVVFAVMLARELQKDMMDIRGDAGFRSPAVLSRCDVHRSALLYRSLLGLALSGFFLIAWLERYDMSHSFPVCIVAAAPLGAALVFNFRAPYQPQQQVALAKLCLYATTALLFWGNGHAVS